MTLRDNTFDDLMADPEVADAIEVITTAAQADGVALTGKDGLLGELIKRAVEAAMASEMTAHLGYAKHAVAGRGSGNSRNGTSATTVQSTAGPIEVDRPRDREGTFDSAIVGEVHQTPR